MSVPHFPFRFPQPLSFCVCASTLLRLPSHRTIRSWHARHSLSLACIESPSPAFPQQGHCSRPMASLCLSLQPTDSFDCNLSASTVPGFGANGRFAFRSQLASTTSGVPCGCNPLPASYKPINVCSLSAAPRQDVTPFGSTFGASIAGPLTPLVPRSGPHLAVLTFSGNDSARIRSLRWSLP